MDRVNELTADQLGIAAGRGIALVEVIPGTPAEKAGFKAHDIVLEFAGQPVTDAPEDFARLVNEAEAGKKLTAVVVRKGQKVEITGIELPDMGKPEARPRDLPGKRLPPPPIDPQGRRDADGFRGNMSVTVSNGEFTIRADQDGVRYVLTGRLENGAAALTDATITENGKETKAAAVDKVPEAYRANVEKLLKSVGGRVRIRD
jgi:membrane-associated protease RseP (regulator of RpoE activity)